MALYWCYCHRVPMLVIQQVQHSFPTKVKEDLSLSKQSIVNLQHQIDSLTVIEV